MESIDGKEIATLDLEAHFEAICCEEHVRFFWRHDVDMMSPGDVDMMSSTRTAQMSFRHDVEKMSPTGCRHDVVLT